MGGPFNGGDKYAFTGKIIIVAFLVIMLISVFMPRFMGEVNADIQSGTSAIVLEAESGRVLYGESIDKPMEMASTTKVVTAITVIENTDIGAEFIIPKAAVGVEGSSIYLREGEKWRILDLLYGLMLRSGNDSAVALAVATSGSVEEFVKLMNKTAEAAGAFRSHFTNPHGLHDKRHYTTAYDLAMITRYAMKNEVFSRIVSTKRHTYTLNGENREFVNKNRMLTSYQGACGVKTGYTRDSGRCLVSAAERENMLLITVVLNKGDMFGDSMRFMDAAFEKYDMVDLAGPGQASAEVRVQGAAASTCLAGTIKNCCYPLTAEERSKITYQYDCVTNLRAPIPKGQYVGKIRIYLDNRLLFNENLYTLKETKKRSSLDYIGAA